MTPPTVNAEYDPQLNDINFPAGVLQPPAFDLTSDAAPNYGDTGGTIGHELTHGFDDEDVWDIAAITAFFGLSNRMASFSDMQPNAEFYLMGRTPKAKS